MDTHLPLPVISKLLAGHTFIDDHLLHQNHAICDGNENG